MGEESGPFHVMSFICNAFSMLLCLCTYAHPTVCVRLRSGWHSWSRSPIRWSLKKGITSSLNRCPPKPGKASSAFHAADRAILCLLPLYSLRFSSSSSDGLFTFGPGICT